MFYQSQSNRPIWGLSKLLTSIILLFCHHFTEAQSIDSKSVFSNTQGIKQNEILFYDVEGYTIFTQQHQGQLDEKGLKKIKKKYRIDKTIEAQADADFPTAKIFVTTNPRTNNVTEKSVHYILPEANKNEIKVVALHTIQSRDTLLEHFFVKSIIDNTIPEEVYSPMQISGIKVADRYIPIEFPCDWLGTHNIQCPNLGQMNWSEFRSLEKAKEMVEGQYHLTASKSIGEVIQKDSIPVVFEGVETTALKIKYKVKIPALILGGSNVLVVYYIAEKVRGKYIACVLSHYTNDITTNLLPPLLQKVMELK